MRRLVLASNNPGKLREFSALFASRGVTVVPQGQLGVGPAAEPFDTYLENALAKARHAAGGAGLPALADDSGIIAEALGGAPGVRSARFSGEGADDQANNRALLARLAGQPDRRAHYTCLLVAVRRADDPEPLVARAIWRGEIIDTPRGAGGFGYDPYFYLPELGRTAAELSLPEKNAISHRGQAMRAMLAEIIASWGW